MSKLDKQKMKPILTENFFFFRKNKNGKLVDLDDYSSSFYSLKDIPAVTNEIVGEWRIKKDDIVVCRNALIPLTKNDLVRIENERKEKSRRNKIEKERREKEKQKLICSLTPAQRKLLGVSCKMK